MATFKNKRDIAADWAFYNVVLEAGVLGFEIDTGKFKMGNGVNTWLQLEYFLPEDAILAYIEEVVASLPSGEVTQQDLDDHINSTDPHPEYDNGFNLAVFYENVKAG